MVIHSIHSSLSLVSLCLCRLLGRVFTSVYGGLIGEEGPSAPVISRPLKLYGDRSRSCIIRRPGCHVRSAGSTTVSGVSLPPMVSLAKPLRSLGEVTLPLLLPFPAGSLAVPSSVCLGSLSELVVPLSLSSKDCAPLPGGNVAGISTSFSRSNAGFKRSA